MPLSLLHVGLGTFRPVSVDNIDEHEMHSEFYQMSEETAALLNKVKERADELFLSVQLQQEHLKQLPQHVMVNFKPMSGWTDIFIYPGI